MKDVKHMTEGLFRPILIGVVALLLACCTGKHDSAALWQGQEAIRKVDTRSVPVQLQYKGVFDLGNGLYCSNEFEGARMNGALRENDTLLTLLITPENTPVNESPWYAFKLWSAAPRLLYVKLTYPEGIRHRYHPHVSSDQREWQKVASEKIYQGEIVDAAENRNAPFDITFEVHTGPDTLWISAQPNITAALVDEWMSLLAEKPFVTRQQIGLSTEGRPIDLLRIGSPDNRQMVMILCRQHPPEVTGYLAMKTFAETLASETALAKSYRERYDTYVVPLMNPDGVARGHWRHNAGGVDLNRDWQDFHQPETAAVRSYLERVKAETGGRLVAGIDFHSTYEDIYYLISPTDDDQPQNRAITSMIHASNDTLGLVPNISPRPAEDAPVSSMAYFFHTHGAEALTYEIGDNTSPALIEQKGRTSA